MKGSAEHANFLFGGMCQMTTSDQDIALHDLVDVKGDTTICHLTKGQRFGLLLKMKGIILSSTIIIVFEGSFQ